MKKKNKKPGNPGKFRPRMIADIYCLAYRGMDQKQIAAELGVSEVKFSNWKAARFSVRYALKKGKEDKNGKPVAGGGMAKVFTDYVFHQLKPETRALWDQMNFWHDEADALDRTEALLTEQGESVRQELFIYGLVHSNFKINEALRVCCIPTHVYKRWLRQPAFSSIMSDLNDHKKHFFEGALMDLIKERNPTAVIFANRTLNADRGYGEKSSVEHSGTINHKHDAFSFTDLDLEPEVMDKVLEAIRKKKYQIANPPKQIETIDV